MNLKHCTPSDIPQEVSQYAGEVAQMDVGKSGKITGKLSCSNADISGSISGQILISETLSLMSTSQFREHRQLQLLYS